MTDDTTTERSDAYDYAPVQADCGLAVLAPSSGPQTEAADPFDENADPPFPVSGVAMVEDVVTHRGTDQARRWPADTLRRAAPKLEGKSIVQDFHSREPVSAPASTVIGQVTDAGYREGTGIVFAGEVMDREAAKKIDRGYLEVSVRALVDDTGDPDARGVVPVQAVADFLDIALVDVGAVDGNEISIGRAVAALSRDALAATFAADGGESGEVTETSSGDEESPGATPDGETESGSDSTDADDRRGLARELNARNATAANSADGDEGEGGAKLDPDSEDSADDGDDRDPLTRSILAPDDDDGDALEAWLRRAGSDD